MLITRRGHGADHGPSSIELPELGIDWDAEKQCLSLTESGISDFSTPSHHDYSIDVSLIELGRMLETLAMLRWTSAQVAFHPRWHHTFGR